MLFVHSGSASIAGDAAELIGCLTRSICAVSASRQSQYYWSSIAIVLHRLMDDTNMDHVVEEGLRLDAAMLQMASTMQSINLHFRLCCTCKGSVQKWT